MPSWHQAKLLSHVAKGPCKNDVCSRPVVSQILIDMAEMNKVCENFVWAGKPHKIGRTQFRLPKKEGGLNWWDLDAKVRSLQATWVHKYLTGKVSPSLDALFREVIGKWASGGNLRHLLNDPDDN